MNNDTKHKICRLCGSILVNGLIICFILMVILDTHVFLSRLIDDKFDFDKLSIISKISVNTLCGFNMVLLICALLFPNVIVIDDITFKNLSQGFLKLQLDILVIGVLLYGIKKLIGF